MTALNSTDIEEFCKICNWTYESWITHRALFDDNPKIDDMMKGKCGHFLGRLSNITYEYVLLQLAKLHDPAIQGNNSNLSLEYVIKYGDWDQETASTLQKLHNELKRLAKVIRPARNKILVHSDRKTILNASNLGGFPKDDDLKYFEALKKFANIVHEKVIGGPCLFDDLAMNDAIILLSVILKSET